MNLIKLLLQNTQIPLIIIWLLISSTSSITKVEAQEESLDIQTHSSNNNILNFIQPQWETEDRPEGRQADLGKRGNKDENNLCQGDLPLSAIAPNPVLGLTLKANPSFYFFVPYQSASEFSANFSLFELQNNSKTKERKYKASFELTETPGVIAVSLPQEKVSLEYNKNYFWQLTIICNQNNREDDEYVRGIVQRIIINPNIIAEIETATLENRAIIYAQNSIWHETLETILDSEFRQNNPEQAEGLLANLLKSDSVKLNHIIGQPILSCCFEKNEQSSPPH